MNRPRTATRLTTICATVVGAVVIMACKNLNADASTSRTTAVADTPTVSGAARPAKGLGLPADFPLAPGLAACRPVVMGPKEVICDWHDANGHAVYQFYLAALPKAGYTLLPGAGEITSPNEFGAIGFTKDKVKGAVSVHGSDVTVQVFYGDAQ